MSAAMSGSSIRVAAVFAACSRPRQVQLSPRIFQLLSRCQQPTRTIHPRLFSTTVRRYVSTVPEDVRTPSAGTESDGKIATTENEEEMGHDEAEVDATEPLYPQEFQTENFKNLMRTVAHPVAIITARENEEASIRATTMAATVSSFNTVSFEPDLIVSFNLRQNSSTYKAMLKSKYFCVTFPTNDAKGAELAHQFTQSNQGRSSLAKEATGEPQIHAGQWTQARHLNRPQDVNNYPVHVSIKRKSGQPHEGGQAFAILCQYQSSVPVGDHVIVTGRLIENGLTSSYRYGWGRHHHHGDAFATSHTSLAYVHGNYTHENGSNGLQGGWKLDDPYRGLGAEKVQPDTRKEATEFYKDRLRSIEEARMLRTGDAPGEPLSPVTKRASDLSLRHLRDFKRFYETKLAEFEPSQLIGGIDLDNLAGWQDLVIRNKMLLSEDDLAKEEQLYYKRLKSLASSSDDTVDILEDLPRMKEFVNHFTDRLVLLREAQRRSSKLKAPVGSTTKQILSAEHQTNRLVAESNPCRRFYHSNLTKGLDAMKKTYRKFSTNLYETNLLLMEATSRPSSTDKATREHLEDRKAFFEDRLVILEATMAKRHAEGASSGKLALPPAWKDDRVYEQRAQEKPRASARTARDTAGRQAELKSVGSSTAAAMRILDDWRKQHSGTRRVQIDGGETEPEIEGVERTGSSDAVAEDATAAKDTTATEATFAAEETSAAKETHDITAEDVNELKPMQHFPGEHIPEWPSEVPTRPPRRRRGGEES